MCVCADFIVLFTHTHIHHSLYIISSRRSRINGVCECVVVERPRRLLQIIIKYIFVQGWAE